MIKEITKEKDVAVYQPQSFKKEKYTIYECSDGKQFTTENDHMKGYKSGKQLADEYEKSLDLENLAKKELKFYSLRNDKHENEGYENSFCFYYHKNLSKQTKDRLFSLVFDLKQQKDMDAMVEGWYLVEQRVYEVESGGMCSNYECKGYFGLLTEFIASKEETLIFYKEIFDKITLTKK